MSRKRNPVYEEAYGYYLAGLSLEQVAKKINVSRQSVFKAFSRRRFQLRGPNFRPEQWFNSKKFTLRNNGYYASTIDDRVYLHRYVWEFYNGKIPEGYDIHHKDEDRSNCSIENLECLLKSEHTKKHGFKNNQYTKQKK